MDDHFDIARVFEIGKFDITRLTCSSMSIAIPGSEKLQITTYSYFMPVCSIVKTITPRCRGPPDALLHEVEG